MTDQLEQAIAEAYSYWMIHNDRTPDLPSLQEHIAQAVRHLLATEPEALGLERVGNYVVYSDGHTLSLDQVEHPDSRPLYALPQEGETNGTS